MSSITGADTDDSYETLTNYDQETVASQPVVEYDENEELSSSPEAGAPPPQEEHDDKLEDHDDEKDEDNRNGQSSRSRQRSRSRSEDTSPSRPALHWAAASSRAAPSTPSKSEAAMLPPLKEDSTAAGKPVAVAAVAKSDASHAPHIQNAVKTLEDPAAKISDSSSEEPRRPPRAGHKHTARDRDDRPTVPPLALAGGERKTRKSTSREKQTDTHNTHRRRSRSRSKGSRKESSSTATTTTTAAPTATTEKDIFTYHRRDDRARRRPHYRRRPSSPRPDPPRKLASPTLDRKKDRCRERSLSRDKHTSRGYRTSVTLTRPPRPLTTSSTTRSDDVDDEYEYEEKSRQASYLYSRALVTSRLQQLQDQQHSIRMYFSLSYMIDKLSDIKPLRSASATPRSCPYLSTSYRLQFSDPGAVPVTLPEITNHIGRAFDLIKESYDAKECCISIKQALISVEFWNRILLFWNELQIVYQRLRVDADRVTDTTNASTREKKPWHGAAITTFARVDTRMNEQNRHLRGLLNKAVTRTLSVEEAIDGWVLWYGEFISHDMDRAWILLNDILSSERRHVLQHFEEAHLTSRDPRKWSSSSAAGATTTTSSSPQSSSYVTTRMHQVTYYACMEDMRNWFHDQLTAQKEVPALDAIYESVRTLINSLLALARGMVITLCHVCDTTCTVRLGISSVVATPSFPTRAAGNSKVIRIWQQTPSPNSSDPNGEDDHEASHVDRRHSPPQRLLRLQQRTRKRPLQVIFRNQTRTAVPKMSITTTMDPSVLSSSSSPIPHDDNTEDGDNNAAVDQCLDRRSDFGLVGLDPREPLSKRYKTTCIGAAYKTVGLTSFFSTKRHRRHRRPKVAAHDSNMSTADDSASYTRAGQPIHVHESLSTTLSSSTSTSGMPRVVE